MSRRAVEHRRGQNRDGGARACGAFPKARICCPRDQRPLGRDGDGFGGHRGPPASAHRGAAAPSPRASTVQHGASARRASRSGWRISNRGSAAAATALTPRRSNVRVGSWAVVRLTTAEAGCSLMSRRCAILETGRAFLCSVPDHSPIRCAANTNQRLRTSGSSARNVKTRRRLVLSRARTNPRNQHGSGFGIRARGSCPPPEVPAEGRDRCRAAARGTLG
jgi:hypothetical protein